MATPITDYKPIDCDFYDHFEIHAMRGTWLNIEYDEGGHEASLIAKIKNLETKDSEEYLITDQGMRIRLDKVKLTTPLDPSQDMRGQLLEKIEYNLWANDRYIDHLDDEGIVIPDNVVKWMSHILNAHEMWNKRMLQMRSRYDVWQVHKPKRWREINKDVHNDTISILRNADLSRVISYETSEGQPKQNTVADIIYHMINHSTYHGGQIAYELRREGFTAIPSDFIIYQLDHIVDHKEQE